MQSEAVREVTTRAGNVTQFALENPRTAAVAIAAVAGLFVAFFIVRYLLRSKAKRLIETLEPLSSISVLMHPNPDPDAMASAIGVKELAESVDTAVTIQYAGEIRHPENRAFETVLELEFHQIETADELQDDVVLVDHNVVRGFEGAKDLEPIAIVDHHPGDGKGTEFTDVRPEQGSCASIVASYLRDRGWRPEADSASKTLDSDLATGLLYGIQADTTAFTRGCTAAEFDAASYLFPAADPDALDRIANPQVDTETLEVKARAIDNRNIRGSFLVSQVGDVSNLDSLPQAAEELVRLEGVTATVVTGERDGHLHLSGRSRDDRVHMGKCIKAAVSPISEASGGGHARMGGGQIQLEETSQNRDSSSDVEERLFAAMNGSL